MAEDIIFNEVRNNGIKLKDIDRDLIYNEVLLGIDDQLLQMGGSLSEHSEMPQPRELSPEEKLRRTFAEENFSRIEMHEIVDSLAHKLNAGQAQLCEDLYQAVHMAAVSDPQYNAQVPPSSSSQAPFFLLFSLKCQKIKFSF